MAAFLSLLLFPPSHSFCLSQFRPPLPPIPPTSLLSPLLTPPLSLYLCLLLFFFPLIRPPLLPPPLSSLSLSLSLGFFLPLPNPCSLPFSLCPALPLVLPRTMADSPLEPSSPTRLPWLVGGSQVVGLACVVITGVWMGHYRGGYAWDGSSKQFNVHPLCMVIGLVFLYGDAILVYRVFRNESKRVAKILHGIIHLISLIISIVGFVSVFGFHAKANIPDMYSLHSWCGMLTFVVFCIQWLMGLTIFLFPGASPALRSWYLSLHVFFGLALFILAIATCLLGIKEKLLFSIMATYSKFVPEGVLANVLGLLLLVFGGLVGYILTRDEFKRPPHPEEEALSMHFKTLTEGESPNSP